MAVLGIMLNDIISGCDGSNGYVMIVVMGMLFIIIVSFGTFLTYYRILKLQSLHVMPFLLK